MPSSKSITRRTFLKKAAAANIAVAAFPYIVPSSALGKAGTTAPSNRITLGHIGVGGRGTTLLKQFLGLKDAQSIAVCDVKRQDDYSRFYYKGLVGREPAKRRVEKHYASQSDSGQYKGCTAYNDFHDLLARDDIDAVVIATTDH